MREQLMNLTRGSVVLNWLKSDTGCNQTCSNKCTPNCLPNAVLGHVWFVELASHLFQGLLQGGNSRPGCLHAATLHSASLSSSSTLLDAQSRLRRAESHAHLLVQVVLERQVACWQVHVKRIF
eukprot:1160649-Pelagomonas_calceolata.AAC.4